MLDDPQGMFFAKWLASRNGIMAIRLVPESSGGIKLKPGTTSSIRLLYPCSSNSHCSTEGFSARPNWAATCPIDIYSRTRDPLAAVRS